jgi:hypothetical protein
MLQTQVGHTLEPDQPTANVCFLRCITQNMADKLVTRFTGVLTHEGSDLGNLTETLELMLADGFQEISGSINSLAGFPVSL